MTFKYQIRNHETVLSTDSLVDGGANRGLAGSHMRYIGTADVSGIANNDLKDLIIETFVP